jgi:hypothetical protein
MNFLTMLRLRLSRSKKKNRMRATSGVLVLSCITCLLETNLSMGMMQELLAS